MESSDHSLSRTRSFGNERQLTATYTATTETLPTRSSFTRSRTLTRGTSSTEKSMISKLRSQISTPTEDGGDQRTCETLGYVRICIIRTPLATARLISHIRTAGLSASNG